MCTYYFHLKSSERIIEDDVGKKLDNANAALAHAKKLIEKIVQHADHDRSQEWRIHITSSDSSVQMVVPFPLFFSLNVRIPTIATSHSSASRPV